MKINFQIKALECHRLQYLFNLSDDELLKLNAKKIVVNEKPGFPCRISLHEASIGETIIAIPYVHHDVNSPYQASGPIFIRDNVQTAGLKINQIPEILKNRFLSIRAYDSQAMMIDAATAQGKDIHQIIQALFLNIYVQYLHIHNANPGCYNCTVQRA